MNGYLINKAKNMKQRNGKISKVTYLTVYHHNHKKDNIILINLLAIIKQIATKNPQVKTKNNQFKTCHK
jgi:hypothetical protein